MKRILIVLGLIAAIVAVFLTLAEKPHPKIVLLGNDTKKPVEFYPRAYQCSECKMPLEGKKFACEAIAPGGKTWFFDEPGCLGLWIADKPFKDKAVLWVYTLDTKRWIDARKAWYSLFESTPMGYGFGAYEHKRDDAVDFETMVKKMKRGENLTNRDYTRALAQRMQKEKEAPANGSD
jgi:copper chaperone NosL